MMHKSNVSSHRFAPFMLFLPAFQRFSCGMLISRLSVASEPASGFESEQTPSRQLQPIGDDDLASRLALNAAVNTVPNDNTELVSNKNTSFSDIMAPMTGPAFVTRKVTRRNREPTFSYELTQREQPCRLAYQATNNQCMRQFTMQGANNDKMK